MGNTHQTFAFKMLVSLPIIYMYTQLKIVNMLYT